MKERKIFRVIFYNQGKLYELYARHVHSSDIAAFVDIEDIIFGNPNSVVIDPSEERLKAEFEGVRRTSVPLQSIVRIDEVNHEGSNRIIDTDTRSGNITPFPSPRPGQRPDP